VWRLIFSMTIGLMILVGVTGALVSLVMIPIIRRSFRPSVRGDVGDFHHVQGVQVSRMGGLAFVGSFVVTFFIVHKFAAPTGDTGIYQTIFIAALAMFLLGFWDDLKPLGARRKLAGQIFIAIGACWAGIHFDNIKNPFTGVIHPLGVFGPALAVVWLVALTNLINLIDGIDGLAGGVALMLMGLLAYVGFNSQMPYLTLCAIGMAGSLVGFLYFNFPPAKIYMGDGGAYFLGFLIAGLSLANSHKGTIVAALIAPLFALALPVIDVSLAILRRGLKGLPLFRPDRNHLHHRLMGVGFSSTRAVLTLYGVSLVFLLLALFAFWLEGRALPILIGFGGLVLLFFLGSFGFGREWFSVGRVLGNSLQMRKTTEYVLTLSRWLELEAERRNSLDEIWADFNFMLARLDFSEVRLTLADGEKIWVADESVTPETERHHWRREFNQRMTLEFTAETRMMDRQLFVHLCELAAEAWHKAAHRWCGLHELPLAFQSSAVTKTSVPLSPEITPPSSLFLRDRQVP
jgi:UDP-GlcNAc:undecaprenyl-phosphate/decaprenyl-phosphate GlcNAc-1-phosphate transferase